MPFGTRNSRFRNVSVKGVGSAPLPRTNHRVCVGRRLRVGILWNGGKRWEQTQGMYPHIINSAGHLS